MISNSITPVKIDENALSPKLSEKLSTRPSAKKTAEVAASYRAPLSSLHVNASPLHMNTIYKFIRSQSRKKPIFFRVQKDPAAISPKTVERLGVDIKYFYKKLKIHAQENQLDLSAWLGSIKLDKKPFAGMCDEPLSQIEVLTLTDDMLTEGWIEKLIKLPKLQKLRFDNCSKLTGGNFLRLLEHCISLRELDIRKCTQISQQVIEYAKRRYRYRVRQIQSDFPGPCPQEQLPIPLSNFTQFGFSLVDDETLVVNETFYEISDRIISELMQLIQCNPDLLPDPLLDALEQLDPPVIGLSLNGLDLGKDETQFLVRLFPHLTWISCKNCLFYETALREFAKLKDLTFLNLTHSTGLLDDELSHFTVKPSIKHLDCTDCPDVTSSQLLKLANGCTTLQIIHVPFCSLVSKEAVKEASDFLVVFD